MHTSNHQIIAYCADERFPVKSTFKLIEVAALAMGFILALRVLENAIKIEKATGGKVTRDQHSL